MALSVVCSDFALLSASPGIPDEAYDHVLLYNPSNGNTAYMECAEGLQNYVVIDPVYSIEPDDYAELSAAILVIFVIAFSFKLLRRVFDTGAQRY